MLTFLITFTAIQLCVFMNVSAMLPQEAAINYPSLNSFDVGTILAFYPFTFILATIVVGQVMSSVGYRKIVCIGICLLISSSLLFGMAAITENAKIFYFVNCVARGISGVADSIICCAVQSIVMLEFHDQKARYLAYLNLGKATGLIVGPLLGVMSYNLWLYTGSFYF